MKGLIIIDSIKIGDIIYGITYASDEIACVNPETVIKIDKDTIETDDDIYKMSDFGIRVFETEEMAENKVEILNMFKK